MTDRSLSSLYRRLATRPSGVGEMLDAETLVAAAEGSLRGDRRDEVAMRLAHSVAQTDLVRMLRELAPASAELAAAMQQHAHVAHAPRGRLQRHAARVRQPGRRRWASLAACLAVALGAVGLFQYRAHLHEEAAMAAAMEAASRPDRIFTSVDRIFSMGNEAAAHADAAPRDGVFHADFSGG
ncbi:MAG: hypothetical protein J0L88_13875 [Xanthomonadales bacterium]|nr:hypothetical protein [Xanthomonadales bacterium]